MRALAVYDAEKMETRDVGRPEVGARDALIAVGAVGSAGKLEDVPRAFAHDRFEQGCIKGVAVLN